MRIGSFGTTRRVIAAVGVCGLALTVSAPRAAGQARVGVAGWDLDRAGEYLDGRQAWWQAWSSSQRDHETVCVSCHTALPYALARPALRGASGSSRPTAQEAKLLADVTKRTTLWSEVQPYYPDQTVGLPKSSESRGTESILNALILARRDARVGRSSEEGRAAFTHMWALQFKRGDLTGAWAWLHFGLAPWESDGAEYFGAALAAVAVGTAPEEYASSPEIQEQVASLREYLLRGTDSERPLDRVMLLWASAELPGVMTPEAAAPILDELRRLQNGDGGWSLSSLGAWARQDGTTTARESDGYATGLVTYVLLRAGIAASEDGLSRALAWLATSQDPADGRWHAASLNKERDPDSERGLFMSDAATAFAVLALTEADRARGTLNR